MNVLMKEACRLTTLLLILQQKLGDPTADVCPLAAAGPAPSPTPRPVRRTVAPTPQSMLSIGPTPSPAAGRMTRKPQGSPTVEPITETGSSGTLLDVLQADSEMSTFLSLASAVQVDDEFLYGGPYTIFVAPDSAYDELGSDYVRLLASHSSFVLHTYSILLNHVTDGTIARNDLVDGSTISLFSGETVNVKERTGGKTFLQTFAASAQMTDPIQVDGTEIDASNGVVYKVGDVLLPIWYYLDALSMLSYQPDVFSTLSQWIVAAGVESEVRSPYVTLLTPVNTAFDGISKEMSEHLLSAEGADDLKAILLYHILPVVVAFPSIPAGSSTIKTVQGESVVIDLKTSNSGQVEIKFNGADTTSYFLTKQSILYAIDSLLIPPSLSAPASTTGPTLSPTFAPPLDTTLYELMETVEDVSVFLLLLEGMGADTILSDSSRGPFTIFAPSNDALERTIGSEYMAKLLELDYDLHLRSLALYHIAPVELRDFQLKDQLLIIMSNQLAVRVERNDNTTSLVTSSIRMGRTDPVTVFDGSAVTENGVFFATDEPILPFWYFFTPVQGLSLAPQSSKFLELVELANLREWLDSLVDVTLVVPNNDAFDMLPAETMDFLRESNNLETLQQVLQYHVMPTVIPFTSLDTDKHNFVTFLDSSVVTFSVALGDEAGQQLRINHAAVVGEGYFLVQHGLVYELASLLIPSWLDLPKSDVIEQLALTIEPIDLLSRSQLVLEEERISNIPYHPPV